jgi:hypothetical protein
MAPIIFSSCCLVARAQNEARPSLSEDVPARASVHNLDVLSAIVPAKANAPSVVDANAVLSLAATFQGLKPFGRCQHLELAPGDPLDGLEVHNRLVVGQQLRVANGP